MNWGTEDFAAAGLIFGAVLVAFWLAWRQSSSIAYLMAFAAGLGALFLIVWVSLAVGIIGEPGHPTNLVFAAVLAVAVIGAIVSRLEPLRLSRTMWVTAAVQAAAGVTTVILTALTPGASGVLIVAGFSLGLVAAFALSAWLFRIEDGMRRVEKAAAFDAAPRPY